MVDKPEPDRIALKMPRELTARLKRYRFKHEIDSRAEAIRLLLEEGLDRDERHDKRSRPKGESS
jgi:metal-responsive CopG/Arc/MetJ family transcriptional regulator